MSSQEWGLLHSFVVMGEEQAMDVESVFDLLKRIPNGETVVTQLQWMAALLNNKRENRSEIICCKRSYDLLICILDEKCRLIFDPETDEKSRRCILESVYDICHEYFENIGVLFSFINAERSKGDSGAALTKAVLFYVALTHRIVDSINAQSRHRYSFLLIPDFKADIYVDSITQDKNIAGEKNILLIHIPYNILHDYSRVIGYIVHEIGHHVGQGEKLRKIRAELYAKCIIKQAIHFHSGDNFSSRLRRLSASDLEKTEEYFIDRFYDEYLGEEWLNADDEGGYDRHLTVGCDIKNYYYSDFCIQSILFRLQETEAMEQSIRNVLRTFSDEEDHARMLFEVCDCKDQWQRDNKLARLFCADFVSDELCERINGWRNDNILLFFLENSSVVSIFRECCADIIMLAFVTDNTCDGMYNMYFNVLLSDENWNCLDESDKFRIKVIYDIICSRGRAWDRLRPHFYQEMQLFFEDISENSSKQYIYEKSFEYTSDVYDSVAEYRDARLAGLDFSTQGDFDTEMIDRITDEFCDEL